MRLSHANVSSLASDVVRPAAAPASSGRIVHLGIGAFHRAHQAVYTQEANEGWRITGVSLRSSHVRDTLAPQDGLYTVTEQSNGAAATSLITVVDRLLVASEDSQSVIDALAAPDTHVVTLTVTEKGYHRDLATGGLRTADPAMASDLAGDSPVTIYGYLAAALAQRQATGVGGLTLISCDNLSCNGTILGTLLSDFLERRDPSLAQWCRTHVTTPDTMVDRIVPASTEADRELVAAAIGVEDRAAIVTEPFRQWVIEDRFAGPRPRWEVAGAQIVADVAPFELAKLRLLNASHSTLAYMGLQLGYQHVDRAMADPLLHGFVARQMRDEAAPCLVAAPGLDRDRYIEAIVDRFANADLHHRLDQIAMDGSQKLPQRWIATIVTRAARGLDSPCHLTSLAAWIAYTSSADVADDPLIANYREIWASTGGDPRQVVERFVADTGVFPAEFQQSRACVAALVRSLTLWRESGPRAAISGSAA